MLLATGCLVFAGLNQHRVAVIGAQFVTTEYIDPSQFSLPSLYSATCLGLRQRHIQHLPFPPFGQWSFETIVGPVFNPQSAHAKVCMLIFWANYHTWMTDPERKAHVVQCIVINCTNALYYMSWKTDLLCSMDCGDKIYAELGLDTGVIRRRLRHE